MEVFQENGIQPTIHFSFYFMDDTMPASIAKAIDRVKNAHPKWNIRVWGPGECRELIEARYPQFLPLYDAFPFPIQRSDFSRYAILHTHGGVYMDTDYKLRRSLDAAIAYLAEHQPDKTAFINASPNVVLLRHLSNSLMVSLVREHPFWMQVMASANMGKGVTRHKQVLTSAGPRCIDRAYAAYKGKDVGVLPLAQFNPCGVCARGNACSKGCEVFASHAHAGAWTTTGTHAMNNMMCDLRWIISVVFLSIGFIIALVLAIVFKQQQGRIRAACAQTRGSVPGKR
jgi:mannosyltransferase OCH1-like enzyme